MNEEKVYEIDQILQEMRSDYWRNLEEVEAAGGVAGSEYLVVRCGGKRYGFPATNCREVLKLPRLVHVPRLPVHLRGIFNLRGEIVAVTDICPLLANDPQEIHERYRLVIVEGGGIKTALLVEFVEGLIRIEDEQVESLAEGAGSGIRDLIAGKVVDGEDVLVLLDLASLLVRPELLVDQKGQAEA